MKNPNPDCPVCGKEIEHKDTYRCRICHIAYCKDCSLEHFGLYEDGDKVNYTSMLKSMWWIIKKKLFNRKGGDKASTD